MADYINNYIAPKMNVSIKWIGPLSIQRVAALAASGEIDMSPLSGKTSEINLSHIVYYSKEMTHKGIPHLLVPKSFNRKINSSQDLYGIRIGLYETVEILMPKILKDPLLTIEKIVGENWYTRAAQMLKLGRVDAIYIPEVYPLEYSLMKHNMSDNWKMVPTSGNSFDFPYLQCRPLEFVKTQPPTLHQ